MPYRAFVDSLRRELESLPVTFLSVVFAWICIAVMIVALARLLVTVDALTRDFSAQRVELTEEALLRTRERYCSSSSTDARSMFNRRQAELQRRYRELTGDWMGIPSCEGLQ